MLVEIMEEEVREVDEEEAMEVGAWALIANNSRK